MLGTLKAANSQHHAATTKASTSTECIIRVLCASVGARDEGRISPFRTFLSNVYKADNDVCKMVNGNSASKRRHWLM